MALETYRAKRNFRTTPEPAGKSRRSGKTLAFVVQKHAASHLHYDFRLELDGVLLSWAVPKGPSLDPADKRLAMHVEDHPLEYGNFEGVIPPGQYGSGTVMVWDRGTWNPDADARAGYEKGHLRFHLNGDKLRGGWSLVRTRGSKYGGKSGDKAWLLIKASDEEAKHGKNGIVDAAPDSATTGRSLEDIAASRPASEKDARTVVRESAAAAPVASVAPRAKEVGKKAAKAHTQAVRKTAAKPDASAAKSLATDAKPDVTPRQASPAGIASITLSNPDKMYFEEVPLRKRDIAQYYADVAPLLLPHLRGRPLSLVRCPDGWSGQCFYQKHADRAVNDAVARIEVPEGKGSATYMGAASATALVALVQWGVIELHPWGSTAPDLAHPDRLIFDFDPGDDVGWPEIVEGVRALQTLLDELALKSFLKTTGGKGLHVVLPIRRTITWAQAKLFTRTIAELLAKSLPGSFTTTMAKDKRRGKIFIDYLRNGEGATAVAPYSVRARQNAPVATPIAWNELKTDVRFHHFNVGNVRARLKNIADPWSGFTASSQTITKAVAARLGIAW